MQPERHHSHSHRKRVARFYLAGVLLLIITADALLLRFAFSNWNPWRMLIGLLFGQLMASMLLIVGMWRRQGWSRYVLIAVLWIMIGIFSLVALVIGSNPQIANVRVYIVLGTGLLLLILANVWVIVSKRLQFLVTAPSSSG